MGNKLTQSFAIPASVTQKSEALREICGTAKKLCRAAETTLRMGRKTLQNRCIFPGINYCFPIAGEFIRMLKKSF